MDKMPQMTLIRTERLLIQPLNYLQLLKYILNDFSLEHELNIEPVKRNLSVALQDALEITILPAAKAAGSAYMFSTLWTIILEDENKMVGDICLIPNQNNLSEIEIGYGTYDAYQGRGIMSEAVGGMIKWLKQQPAITSIIATTNQDNLASFKILARNGFTRGAEINSIIHWILV
jgi:RimJ/RimL family protein N-acetyltransferase